MSVFSFLFGKSDKKKIEVLEKRVLDLENALLEVTMNFKKLASLSLRTGEELENLAEYVKLREHKGTSRNVSLKKTDDFYN